MNTVIEANTSSYPDSNSFLREGVLLWDRTLRENPPYQARFVTDDGAYQVTCLVDPPLFGDPDIVDKVQAKILRQANDQLVVFHVQRDVSLDPLDVTPAHLCPFPSTVDSVRDLLDGITTPALRRLVSDVFSLKRVFSSFWTATAGREHHSWTGGLARHSVEVATRAARVMASPDQRQVDFTTVECEIGMVVALLHDIGKTVSYSRDGFSNARALVLGHELLGLELIRQPMDTLRAEQCDLADALSTLLLSRTRNSCGPYRLEPIRQVISHCDRASVARDRAKR